MSEIAGGGGEPLSDADRLHHVIGQAVLTGLGVETPPPELRERPGETIAVDLEYSPLLDGGHIMGRAIRAIRDHEGVYVPYRGYLIVEREGERKVSPYDATLEATHAHLETAGLDLTSFKSVEEFIETLYTVNREAAEAWIAYIDSRFETSYEEDQVGMQKLDPGEIPELIADIAEVYGVTVPDDWTRSSAV